MLLHHNLDQPDKCARRNADLDPCWDISRMNGWQQHITHAQGAIKGTATKVKAATKSAGASTMPVPLQPCPLVSVVITVTKGPMLFISTNLLSKSKSCVSPIISQQLVLRVKEQGLLKYIPLAWFMLFCLTLSGLKRSWIIKSGQSYLGQPCNNSSVWRWELKCLGALGNVFSATFYDHCPKVFDSVF